MKIGIVNDLALAQEVLKEAIESVPELKIIWTALDGQQAIDMAEKETPDVILMDLIMPNVNGAQATKEIMKKSPCSILIVTASIEGNGSLVYEAMGHGALDVICTPHFNSKDEVEGASELIDKIERIGIIINKPIHGRGLNKTPITNVQNIIAIGASTGGPQALAQILGGLPAGFPAAIVIVQHVDHHFAQGLATWLDKLTPLDVEIIQKGDPLKNSTVQIAATQDHLVIESNNLLNYTANPIDMIYRPSIDVFFKSLSLNYTKKGTAVLLTGMGQDGAEGMLMLKNKGWHTIAQDEESCIVYSMPKAAIEQDAASEVASLNSIAGVLINRIQKPKA